MGEIAALASSAVWAIASLVYARLGLSINALALNLLKCTLALLMLAVTLLLWGALGQPSAFWPTSQGLSLLGLSGLIGITLGDTAYFLSLNHLGPRQSLLLSALAPPFTAILAALFLKESITFAMLLGMTLTLGGILWVIQEQSAPHSPTGAASSTSKAGISWRGVGYGVLAALCQASGNILTKKGGESLPALSIATLRLASGVISLFLVVLLLGRLSESLRPLRHAAQLRWLALATFLGTFLGIWLQVAGLRYTSHTGIASTLSSTSPIFILPLAVFVLHERLSPRAILGAILAVAGVACLFLFPS